MYLLCFIFVDTAFLLCGAVMQVTILGAKQSRFFLDRVFHLSIILFLKSKNNFCTVLENVTSYGKHRGRRLEVVGLVSYVTQNNNVCPISHPFGTVLFLIHTLL